MAAVALLAGTLLIPARISLVAALTLSGGYGEARINWLCFVARIPMRLYLLRGKRLHLDILHCNGTVRKRISLAGAKPPPKSHWSRTLLSKELIKRVNVSLLLGIADVPAATAMLSGAAESALSNAAQLLLPHAEAQVCAVPYFSGSAFRVELSGIVRIKMGKLIKAKLQKRGE